MKPISHVRSDLFRAFALSTALIVLTACQPAMSSKPQVKIVPAFENVKWSDWSPVDDAGKPISFRPIEFLNAGDGTNRIFVATQRGVIHLIESGNQPQTSKVFLDISDKVHYFDKKNEEGLLGVAFHPDYKTNGEFFIYYTTEEAPQTSVVSRFRVSKDNPNKADADFEEEIFRLKQPFWNHNGGTTVFGPDGYLYIALGDGGSKNDPRGHGQNTHTLLGSILRIDVDQKSNGKSYAIPKDNPFANNPKAGKPEIYAWGFRNIWRMSFDSKTGRLWAGDVGQDLWEEIDIVVKGGNYGWKIREGRHPFQDNNSPATNLIDPVFEYDHETGKSITGGVIYRGRKHPDLNGMYLYADYVTGWVWALEYDDASQKVVANHKLGRSVSPIISFGTDTDGEVFFTTVTPTGKSIFTFARTR